MLKRPDRTIWCKEHARRAAVLIDAAQYFGAARAAMLKAQSRIFILGWDIHSRAAFVGESGKADDGFPEAFGDFLSALVKARPKLQVNVLLWDFAMLYATEREFFPIYSLRWNTPPGVQFCLDDAVPLGSSQHQKLIVIDDSVAFSGGLDVTVRRWDTSEHRFKNPFRRDPAGNFYRPFHDVQAIVEGEAAKALGRLARGRWQCAAGERIGATRGPRDCWPDNVTPDFNDVEVAIARTQPAFEDQQEVREVEALFLESIGKAERVIYVENQFLSSMKIAKALLERLREKPALELLVVAPKNHDSWLEMHSMRNGRIRFMREFDAPEIAPRVRLMYPEVKSGPRKTHTMVHSKVMIIDDVFLRIGSANLNNRSMATDTECDLFIEATKPAERAAITEIRNRLMGDHTGSSPQEVAEAYRQKGSLLAVADTLSNRGHRLRPVDDGEADRSELATYIEGVADPERPIGAEKFVSGLLGGLMPHRSVSTIMKAILLGLAVIAGALVWEYTPLAEMVDPKAIGATLRRFADGPLAPLVVLGIFVGGGLIVFPVVVLIAATAATFGPVYGFAYAFVGTMASALVTYGLGAWLGKRTLRDLLGPKLESVRRKVARKGVLAVALIRMVPVAPFTVVNMLAGASQITLTQFTAGTAIGMAPGILIMSLLGHQLSQIVLHPSASSIGLLAAAIFGWIALSVGVQALISKYWDTKY
jgi:phospholipase D1/2